MPIYRSRLRRQGMAAECLRPDLPTPDIVQFLDADPSPTFLIPIDSTKPIEFRIVLKNGAFRGFAGLESLLRDQNNTSLKFQSWAQAINNWSATYDFAGRTWTAFSIQGQWKAVRALDHTHSTSYTAANEPKKRPSGEETNHRQLECGLVDVRLENMQRMMEMSDVGVFEYHPNGTLIHANESWYKLSRHPRATEAHKDFSFMDLVFPEDIPLVMSQWNKLSSGCPVTFEMRWKAPLPERSADDEEGSQWVLSACVPVLDDQGNLVSIAGNTIDISAQKRRQQEALQRAEALERARSSEEKFARFAETAPVGIYIFDRHKKMQYCNRQFFESTGHPITDPREVDWRELVFPEDVWIVEDGWKVVLDDRQPVSIQFRLCKKWDDADGKTRQAWAQTQTYPDCDAAGNIKQVLGTLTDITRFKWAEDVQRTRVEEALEAKRQQEKLAFPFL